VGDDLFCTNIERLDRGIEENVANAILIKLNQIGSLTETLAVHRARALQRVRRRDLAPLRRDRGHLHRDLAVGDRRGADQNRSASRTDRVAKYNQLLRIAEELGDTAYYPGRHLYGL